VKIIQAAVAELALADGKTDAIHFDDALPGFGLRLRKSGDKVLRSYVAQYKRAGQTRRVLLGSADVLSADKARTAAKQVLAKVALGEDPQQQRVERRTKDRLTLRSVVAQFLADKQDAVRPRTLGELTRYLTGSHFKPLHGMPVDTVASASAGQTNRSLFHVHDRPRNHYETPGRTRRAAGQRRGDTGRA